MSNEDKAAEVAPVERDAEADFNADRDCRIIDERKSFENSKYLTVNINNGKAINLKELQKLFPNVGIFKIPHLEIFNTDISLYRLDHKLRFKK